MVLIPNDIGVRMRILADSALLQPTAPVQGIPSDLPDLRPGQFFSAQIRDSLPDNTYRALVAGKELTLSLPAGAKTGDTLELVVVERSDKTVVAHLANKPPSDDATTPYPYTSLSSTAKLIGSLLPAEGAAPEATELSRSGPIVKNMAAPTADIARAIATAVEESGLFYESHQAQWISGQRPLVQLLQEPQAQHSDFKVLVSQLLQTTAEPKAMAPQGGEEKSVLVGRHSSELPGSTIAQASIRQNLAVVQRQPDDLVGNPLPESVVLPRNDAIAGKIPDEIRPLVQQQLETLATQRMVWHGEIWPQQPFELEINKDAHSPQQSGQPIDQWTTSVRLTLPRLGELAAKVVLTEGGVRLGLQSSDPLVAEQLRSALPALQESLEAAGVPLLGALVRHEESAS